uniref:Uncharacterized protein n=1 Tax=Lactuca sativa TaxID=4236 RepID=A0A9R1WQE1_LACSA|nr:hypothetical protein LSAT_V11C100023460 [Lactuca sativa]
MDPNQNSPPNYRNRKLDNAFVLDTTPCQFPTMDTPKGGFCQFASKRFSYPTNTTFPTTISTFSDLPTTTNPTTIPTILTIPTTPTTSVTTTTTTNFTTTIFAGFCFGNTTFTTTSTKKEKRKKNRVDPPPPKKGSHAQKTKKKIRAIFYELMESETQNADQITSKWRIIRLKCIEFGGI